MTLPTAAAGKWRGSKQTEAADRTATVVPPSALQAQRWETYNAGAPRRERGEVTGCQVAVTTRHQDSLQQRKESGLLRSKSHHELLYLWGGGKYAQIFQPQLFLTFICWRFSSLHCFIILIIHHCLVLFGSKSLSVKLAVGLSIMGPLNVWSPWCPDSFLQTHFIVTSDVLQ